MARNSLNLGALLLTLSSSAGAGVIDQIVSFGDSLTDNGNALIVYQNPGIFGPYPPGAPVPLPPNYTTGRFTDGPDTTPASKFPGKVWVEDLAGQLGVPSPTPSLAGGTNYAIGSAQTGTVNPQDMGNQLASFLTSTGGVVAATNLYTFWGGANDILDGNSPVTAANNIKTEIETLAGLGGKYFEWLNLPPVPALGAGTGIFDATMAADITALQSAFPADVFVPVNVAGFYESGAGGLDLTCIGQLSADPDKCASWDGLHPTNLAHAGIGALADQSFNAAIPEPALWWVTGMAVAGVLGWRRRKMTRYCDYGGRPMRASAASAGGPPHRVPNYIL